MLNRTFYFYQIFEDYATFKEFTDQLHLYTAEADELLNQYIYEKSLIEQYGYRSITTFEEWLRIKHIKL